MEWAGLSHPRSCEGIVCNCCITRWFASTAESDQSIPAVGFAAKRMNNRTVSAPNCSIICSGETVFPSDLLIFAERSPSGESQCGHGEPQWSTESVTEHVSQNGALLLTMPRKYQDESTKVSIVSVSLRAGFPHLGQSTLRKDSEVSSGFPFPSNTTSRGSSTGN